MNNISYIFTSLFTKRKVKYSKYIQFLTIMLQLIVVDIFREISFNELSISQRYQFYKDIVCLFVQAIFSTLRVVALEDILETNDTE